MIYINEGIISMVKLLTLLTVSLLLISYTEAQQPDEPVLIQKDGQYGYTDKTGSIIISPRYEVAYNFSEGLAGVKLNNSITASVI